MLEPALARLAALHRTDEDLESLKSLHTQLIDATGNFQRFSLVNIEWHKAVARASGNELLAAVLDAIAYGVAVSTTTEEYDTPETRQQVIRIHAQIAAAIEAQNAEQAEGYMRQHISATHARALTSETIEVPLSDDSAGSAREVRAAPPPKPRRARSAARNPK